MKTVGSRELKNRLGRYLGLVRRGETIIVTDRGKTVAHIVPPKTPNGKARDDVDEILKQLEAEGHLRLGTRPFKRFKPVHVKGKPVSQMIPWKTETDAVSGRLCILPRGISTKKWSAVVSARF